MGCTTVPVEGSVPLSAFVAYVRPYVLGVPQNIIEDAVRKAAIEFCQIVKIIKRTVYIDSVANVSDYQIDIDDDYRPVSVLKVTNPERELPPRTTMPVQPYQWAPLGHLYNKPRDIYLFPTPSHDCEEYFTVELFVQPGQDTCVLDQILYDDWAEALGFGALARIFNMTDGSWYNPRQAAAYEIKFNVAKGRGKTAASRSNSAAPLQMTAKRWV